MRSRLLIVAMQIISTVLVLHPINNFAQESSEYLYDRGTGIPMSIFGTYVRQTELLVFPSYEYYYDSDLEYEPFEFGHCSTREYRGRYEAHEFLIFLGYGITDRLAIEFKAGVITAKLNKSENDTSSLPPEINESGLSDIEGQLRWRWNFESSETPEFFNYFEYVFPTGERKV